MKVLLLDLDGVLITGLRFGDAFADAYDVPREEVQKFFKNEFRPCITGKADLKIELAKYLPLWGWEKSMDDFLTYWFESNEIDATWIEKLKQYRANGIKCYVASDNEKYRAEYLLNQRGLAQYFDGAFFSHALGCTKNDKEFFEHILKTLGDVEAIEITYIDDDPNNVATAKTLGIDGQVWI